MLTRQLVTNVSISASTSILSNHLECWLEAAQWSDIDIPLSEDEIGILESSIPTLAQEILLSPPETQ